MLIPGERYTRAELYRLFRVPRTKQGGNWNTGYHCYDGQWFVFTHLGTEGRTGHDYGNHWAGNELVWRGKTGSESTHPSIMEMTSGVMPVHVFIREQNREPFEYLGLACARAVHSTVPVTVHWAFGDGK